MGKLRATTAPRGEIGRQRSTILADGSNSEKEFTVGALPPTVDPTGDPGSLLPPPGSAHDISSASTELLCMTCSSRSSSGPCHDVVTALSAGAAWDLIQAHLLVKQGLVDIGDTRERLKKLAVCDTHCLCLKEMDVTNAIGGCE